MRKLILSAIVIALLVGGDLAARRAVEVELERRIRDQVSAEQGVTPRHTRVHISSFPFLARLGATGDVKTLRASVSDTEVAGFRFATISVDLHDVHIDRESLVFDRRVVVKRIGSGEATADISQATLREAIGGLPLVLGPGTIGVTLGGVTVSVSAKITNGVLELSAAGLDLPAIALPRVPLVPCLTQAEARRGVLHLTCAVRRVPSELLARASGH